MADIKITYFNATGRAEISRLILAYSGVKFTDERITGEQFGAMKADKSKLPYGQLPVLCHKGKLIGQSMTIARFLAEEYCLAGRNNCERAEASEIVDTLCDVQGESFKVMFTPADKKEAAKEKLCNLIDSTFEKLECRLDSRGGQHFAGNALTWADLFLWTVMDLLSVMKVEVNMDKFPKIHNLNCRVAELPNVKHWAKTRPQ